MWGSYVQSKTRNTNSAEGDATPSLVVGTQFRQQLGGDCFQSGEVQDPGFATERGGWLGETWLSNQKCREKADPDTDRTWWDLLEQLDSIVWKGWGSYSGDSGHCGSWRKQKMLPMRVRGVGRWLK